jgi:hypothetical protein
MRCYYGHYNQYRLQARSFPMSMKQDPIIDLIFLQTIGRSFHYVFCQLVRPHNHDHDCGVEPIDKKTYWKLAID